MLSVRAQIDEENEMRKKFLLIALMGISQMAVSAEISVIPGDTVYLNSTNPGKNYNDLAVHSILISTGADETFIVHGMRIDMLSGGQIVLSKSLSAQRLVDETQGLAQMVDHGMGIFLRAQILSEEGFQGLFGRQLSLASADVLSPNEVLMLTRQHFSLDFSPDNIEITVFGADETGKERTLNARVPVAVHGAPIRYEAPLKGAWMMTSLPSIQSHHRLNPPTEYAIDFFKTNGAGKIHDGDELKAENFFGYGADVLAAADGEVVFVIADETQNRAAYLPRDGESDEEAGARIGQYNMRRYAADFARAAAGNVITIKHTEGGITEFSSYGHLKADSVKVKVGDVVRRGQIIAEVGDTGDSAAVHLHFQINDGANAFMSRSLPVKFLDLEETLGGVDPGQYVVKTE